MCRGERNDASDERWRAQSGVSGDSPAAAQLETLEGRMLLAATLAAPLAGDPTDAAAELFVGARTPSSITVSGPIVGRAGSKTTATAPVVYSGPLVITRGGTYRGNWESLDPDVPAVTVRT